MTAVIQSCTQREQGWVVVIIDTSFAHSLLPFSNVVGTIVEQECVGCDILAQGLRLLIPYTGKHGADAQTAEKAQRIARGVLETAQAVVADLSSAGGVC